MSPDSSSFPDQIPHPFAVLTGGVILVLVVTAIAGVVLIDIPRVEEVDNDWGTVTQNKTEIETQITIDNSVLLRLGESLVDLEYTVSFNDVRMAHGREREVQFSGSEETIINVTTFINNDAIPEWWASHINRNGTTTVRVQPDAIVEPVGITLPMQSRTRTRTVETDLLAPLQTTENRRFQRFGRTLLIINKTTANWGHATVNRTPLHASATVTNPTPVPIPVADIGYRIHMNGIRIGQSTLNQQTVIPPHSTRTIETKAVINNNKLDEWWVTHLRQNESTRLRIDFSATIEVFDQQIQTPLGFLSYSNAFHTNIFRSTDGLAIETRTNSSNTSVSASMV